MAWEKEQLQQAGQQVPGLPQRQTRRQQLEWRRNMLTADLAAIEAALTALDTFPELEKFIETLAKAGA